MNRGSGDPLPVVHLALAGGVVVLAAVLFGFVGPLATVEAPGLRWVWLGLAVVAILAAGTLRVRIEAAGGESDRWQGQAIVIWALAEGQALAGLFFYLLTGDVVPGAAGVLLFFFLWWRHRPAALPGGS